MYRSAQAAGALLILTAGLVFGGATSAHAASLTDTVDGFTFTVDSSFSPGAATITNYTPGPHDVEIPATLTTGGIAYPVTTIGDWAFAFRFLTSVTIPDSVTHIGRSAFSHNDLTSVRLPNDLQSISDQAFIGNDLTSVTIPNRVHTINSHAFGANALTSVTLPDSVTHIGQGAFWNNRLTSVTIPDGVIVIDSIAFQSNALVSVTIPNSVTEIGQGAFEHNRLTSVTIPDGLQYIAHSAFAFNALTSVTIPDGVTWIATSAFASNALTSVTIPDSVRAISFGAFQHNRLTSVTIPDRVTWIAESAFAFNALTSVTIPDRVTSIEQFAFENNQLTLVTIPNSVNEVGPGAFRDNRLASVTIPNSVTSIGRFAFENNQLTSVTIPNSVTTIGLRAFNGNPSAWFLVPASVTDVVVARLCSSEARTVTFNSVGGSAVSRAIACSDVAVPAPVAPTRAGYTFAGWSATQSGGVLFDFTSPITTSTTLFAQWSAQSHFVTFNSQGGSAVDASSFLTDGFVTLPPAPTRSGFTFTGWFVAVSGGTALVSPYSPPSVDAITVFAQWSAQSHVVTFNSQGGGAVAERSFLTGGSVTLPPAPAPTRSGFTFTGWFAAASGGAALVSPYSPPGVDAITVFAQWSAAARTPTFGLPIATADGFRVTITNYDPAFTWTLPTVSRGFVVAGTPSGSNQVLTVSGLAPGTSAAITQATARAGFDSGLATVTGTSITGAALTPTFGTPTQTLNGFTVTITNYDSAFTWLAPTVSVGSVVAGTPSGANQVLTVTGLTPGTSATITQATTRPGFSGGLATVAGSSLSAALTPTFGAPTATVDGFTVEITNYDSAFTWLAPTVSVGSVAVMSTSGANRVLTVTGLTPGTSATITQVTTRPGFAGGLATVAGSSLNAALTPTFGATTATVDGFTVMITNYSSAFMWETPTISAGSVVVTSTSGANRVLRVTGLASGTSATITQTTTRAGFDGGSTTVAGASITGAALTPTFGTPTQTPDGFTVTITNYDAAFTWTSPAVSAGSVAVMSTSGADRVLTVTGLTPGASATITQATTRLGFDGGLATVAGSSLSAALTPTFGAPTATVDGFTVMITNYSSAFMWETPTISAGSVVVTSTSGANRVLTVTGLAAGTSATITQSTMRAGFNDGLAVLVGSSLSAALTPTFGAPTATADGFTVTITNYNSASTWLAPNVSAGSVTVTSPSGSDRVLTVTGLAPGTSAAITQATTRAGFDGGLATVTGTSITGAALTPTFGTPTQISNGFTVTITNYDPAFTWLAATVSVGSVTVTSPSGADRVLTVTGLVPGTSAAITQATTRAGFDGGLATVTGTSITGVALTPTFGIPTQTLSGFTVTITNYDSLFTWLAPTISAGSVEVTSTSGANRVLTVTGLTPGTSATIAQATTRAGYSGGSTPFTGTSITGVALTPTFGTPTQTSNGFTVTITNYDSAFTWLAPNVSAGSVTVTSASVSNQVLTVTGLASGTSATITQTTARAGFGGGSTTVAGTSITGAGLTPTFGTPTQTPDGFTVTITNYDPAFTWATPSVSGGSVVAGIPSGANQVLTVTGLAPGTSATVTQATTRTGFTGGSATVAGRSLTVSAGPPGGLRGDVGLDLGSRVGESITGVSVDYFVERLQVGSTWTLTLRSTPQIIASGIVDGSGTVRGNAAIPAGLEAGWHSITLIGTNTSGAAVSKAVWFELDERGVIAAKQDTAPTSPATVLARTGGDIGGLLTGALALLMLGLLALAFTRRQENGLPISSARMLLSAVKRPTLRPLGRQPWRNRWMMRAARTRLKHLTGHVP